MNNIKFVLLKNKKTRSELNHVIQETANSGKYIFILDCSDKWNDYGFRTLIHLTVVYQQNVIIDSEIFSGHSKSNEIFDWTFDKLFEAENSSKLFLDNMPPDIVTLGDISFYRILFSNLPKEIVFEYLSKVNDIAFDTKIMRDFLDESEEPFNLPDYITVSFFRNLFDKDRWDNNGESNRINEDTKRKIWKNECKKIQSTINIIHSQIQNGFSHDLSFKIDSSYFDKKNINSSIILKNNTELRPMRTNCFALIGSNGVGKTTLLHSILKKYQFEQTDDSTFSQIAMISFDVNTQIDLDIENDYRRLFVGAINNGENSDKKIINELYQNIIFSLDRIALNSKQGDNTNLDILKKGFACFYFDSQIVRIQNLMLEYISAKKFDQYAFNFGNETPRSELEVKKELKNTVMEMSSGQKMIFSILLSLSSIIMPKSLVLIDEPENTLHPPFIMALIDAINILATEQDSLVLLSTHSPLIVQELIKQNVIIMANDENTEMIRLNNPKMQTFAASVDTLNDYIFGLDIQKSGHIKFLKELSTNIDNTTLESIKKKWDLTPYAMSYVAMGFDSKDK